MIEMCSYTVIYNDYFDEFSHLENNNATLAFIIRS